MVHKIYSESRATRRYYCQSDRLAGALLRDESDQPLPRSFDYLCLADCPLPSRPEIRQRQRRRLAVNLSRLCRRQVATHPDLSPCSQLATAPCVRSRWSSCRLRRSDPEERVHRPAPSLRSVPLAKEVFGL